MHSWPLWDLVLRTPRLELRPDDDAAARALSDLALDGVHDPASQPFTVPWTDGTPEQVWLRNLQHRWRLRAELAPAQWTLSLVAYHAGTVVGVQDLRARAFASRREVVSGSWLGMRYQNLGLGREMRAAMLLLAFDHLGARRALTSAWHDNPRSLAISTALGYRHYRTTREPRRGVRTAHHHLRLDAADLVRPAWTLDVSGVDGCRPLLGA